MLKVRLMLTVRKLFYKQLKEKKVHWDNIEKGCIPGFYECFSQHKCEEILSGMLWPI